MCHCVEVAVRVGDLRQVKRVVGSNLDGDKMLQWQEKDGWALVTVGERPRRENLDGLGKGAG